jgi:hypothetical protein
MATDRVDRIKLSTTEDTGDAEDESSTVVGR